MEKRRNEERAQAEQAQKEAEEKEREALGVGVLIFVIMSFSTAHYKEVNMMIMVFCGEPLGGSVRAPTAGSRRARSRRKGSQSL